jgi:hypothetical protein
MDDAAPHPHHHEDAATGIKAYFPLIVIVAIAFLGAFALHVAHLSFMASFMGLFFLLLAMFKFFDLRGFADGFTTYDLIAKKYRPYAYAYPFMELALGVAYLSGVALTFTSLATVILMTVSAVGVFKEVSRGSKIKCACLGTALSVPLSTVSIVENVGMGAMALWMLIG